MFTTIRKTDIEDLSVNTQFADPGFANTSLQRFNVNGYNQIQRFPGSIVLLFCRIKTIEQK